MRHYEEARDTLLCGTCGGAHCYWCGAKVRFGPNVDSADRRLATREHIVARADGGSDAPWNLELACAGCNNARGIDRTWVPFHTHNGDAGLMGLTQKLAYGAIRVGPTGVSVDEFVRSNPATPGVPRAAPVKIVRRKCSTCSAAITGAYPGKTCYACHNAATAKEKLCQ